MQTCNVTVSIPTYKRIEKLLETLEKICACEPRPDEIIIHVDGGDDATEVMVRERFPCVRIIRSREQQGPGGGRNKILAAARNPIVASFDDDSYPLDRDYFARLETLFERFPEAAVLEAAIYHAGEEAKRDELSCQWVAVFTGCGCAYRTDVFRQTSGYVPRPVGYGMEENDLALRLHAKGFKVLRSSWLRVFHNTRLEHHASARITAGMVENVALHAFLRYPVYLWCVGFVQTLKMIFWLIRHRRTAGILRGLAGIPRVLLINRTRRETVGARHIFSYLRLRKNPGDVQSINASPSSLMLESRVLD